MGNFDVQVLIYGFILGILVCLSLDIKRIHHKSILKILIIKIISMTQQKSKIARFAAFISVFFVLGMLVALFSSPKKPDYYTMMKESDIQFVKNPGTGASWGDLKTGVVKGEKAEENVGLKIGETIGFVMNISEPWGKMSGSYDDKREFSLKNDKKIIHHGNSLKTYFNFYRENCWGDENRDGMIQYMLDIEIQEKFFNQKCLVIGTVEDLSSRRPKHACDNDVWAHVYLKNSYIEIYETEDHLEN